MPAKKRRRTDEPSTPLSSSPPEPTTPNLNSWPGWCEIESEPAFFTTILKDIGVRSLKVQEVFGVDDTAFAILPKPVHAVIFLFRYQADGDPEQVQETECPSRVWFANQIPQYACGTVALLNIVNNIQDLELGQPLQSFKDFTESFDPVARGYAIDSFDFVRKIHNSFARDTDMLAIDFSMHERTEKIAKKQKTQAVTAARVTKAAKKAAEKAAERAANTEPNKGALRSNPSRRARNNKPVIEDVDQESEESGFHFVAYMPIDDDVWKLDGLDSFPTAIGTIEPGQDWLNIVQTSLSVRMAQYEEGQLQFSLMAVVRDPVIEDRRALAQNIRSLQHIKARLDEVSETWRSFVASDFEDSTLSGASEEYGLTNDMIAEAPTSQTMAQQLRSSCPDSLSKVLQELMTSQAGCRAQVRDSQQAEITDAEESMHRRHDYGSFVQAWMQALVDNEALKPLLDEELR
ncbi:cysteine proteinase [Aureobasidium subglaciale]|nr:cysteine proteinase [Aureobasidium subglaciale]KAI5217296.1 cysteine proteinase [Aureobasidium subglaciale]KAI5220944.1 cysteine proteinase [Aureobasidium subglaciale]KAI5258455.1 cysteine proteinase [Aureobasidium subglaciale]